MLPRYSNRIDGTWVDSDTHTRNINPSDTNDVIGEYARASKQDTEQAIQAARAAFPGWSRTTPQVTLRQVLSRLTNRPVGSITTCPSVDAKALHMGLESRGAMLQSSTL